MPQEASEVARVPETRPKYGELRSRLQRLQQSPSFASSAPALSASTGRPSPAPDAARLGDSSAVFSPVSLYPGQGDSSLHGPRTPTEARAHGGTPWRSAERGSSQVSPLLQGGGELLIAHGTDTPSSQFRDPQHGGPSPVTVASHQTLGGTVSVSQRPVTPKGMEIYTETQGLLDGLAKLPPVDQVRVLESRLRASAIMYDQMVAENMILLKEKQLAERAKDDANEDMALAKELMKKTIMSPDVVSQTSPDANQQELSLMQRQMSATCQELIAARKAVREKDSMLRDFKEELASELRMRRAEADAHKHEMRKLDVLQDNFAKVTSEKDLLEQQLDKAHSDLVELNVKAAELEHMATKGEAAVKERDECKAECDELKDSNSRMGQRVAEMASRNSILEQENGEQKSTVQQQRHDLTALKQTVKDMERAFERLESQTREQQEALTGQLGEANAALDESRDKISELTQMWEALLKEKEYVQDLLVKKDAEMVQVRGKNSKLVQQNKKLAVEIPKQLMAQVSKMEEQLHDAKVTRDKQIRVLFRRVERRDLEIFHLRSVWRALLTSHPDIDRAGEAMIAEIKAMEHEKEKLELELADEQEQKEALIITVAVSYLKLVLANWRRPTYQKSLVESLKESAALEEQAEEWERYEMEKAAYEAGQLQHFSVTADVTHSPKLHHEPDILMQRMMHVESPTKVRLVGVGHSVSSPPMSSFDDGIAAVPKSSSNWSVHRVVIPPAALSSGTSEDRVPAMKDGEEGYNAAHYTRQKALQEGRQKYAAIKTCHERESTHTTDPDPVSPTSPIPPPPSSRLEREDRRIDVEEEDAMAMGNTNSSLQTSDRKLERITIAGRNHQVFEAPLASESTSKRVEVTPGAEELFHASIMNDVATAHRSEVKTLQQMAQRSVRPSHYVHNTSASDLLQSGDDLSVLQPEKRGSTPPSLHSPKFQLDSRPLLTGEQPVSPVFYQALRESHMGIPESLYEALTPRGGRNPNTINPNSRTLSGAGLQSPKGDVRTPNTSGVVIQILSNRAEEPPARRSAIGVSGPLVSPDVWSGLGSRLSHEMEPAEGSGAGIDAQRMMPTPTMRSLSPDPFKLFSSPSLEQP